MKRSAYGEIAGIAVIALLVAIGGKLILALLGQNKIAGGLIFAGLVFVTITNLRGAYDPSLPDARVTVTKYAAYFCAAALCLWAIIAPAKWVMGTAVVSMEVALIFDLISVAARARTGGSNAGS